MARRSRRRAFIGSAAAAALLSFADRAFGKVLGYPRAMQGPMVGASGPGHFTVWVRASGEYEVRLEISREPGFAEPLVAGRAQASREADFCVRLTASGLEPDTPYYYRLRFAGQLDRFQPLPHRTRTAPAGPADFSVAFGSCCRVQGDDRQRIFSVAQQLEPRMFLWLGDNIYADSDQPAIHADLYRRGRLVESLVPLLRSTPQLAIWDDHDFGYNDSDGANPAREAIRRVFRDYWANPPREGDDDPGIHFAHSFGGIDFFFLDGRYHRAASDAPAGPGKTMLGARQKAWLKGALAASRAPFKVIASGGGWSLAERAPGGDSWAVYRAERDEILDFIRDRRIGGVVCISGDSHMGELNCIPRSAEGGYDIYDFCSSPLAQTPAAKFVDQVPEVRARPVWARSENVGLLTFAWKPRPTLTLRLYNTLGESVWAPLVLTPEDLVNGARSWDRLSDPAELRRLRSHAEGRGYYGFPPAP